MDHDTAASAPPATATATAPSTTTTTTQPAGEQQHVVASQLQAAYLRLLAGLINFKDTDGRKIGEGFCA
jgi:hypothetical protein